MGKLADYLAPPMPPEPMKWTKKLYLQAAAQVPEYWILDVVERRMEVYRHPGPDPTELLGFTYDPPVFVDEAGSVRPVAMPDAEVKIAELLPTTST
jgi:Uma2 family endonuclease